MYDYIFLWPHYRFTTPISSAFCTYFFSFALFTCFHRVISPQYIFFSCLWFRFLIRQMKNGPNIQSQMYKSHLPVHKLPIIFAWHFRCWFYELWTFYSVTRFFVRMNFLMLIFSLYSYRHQYIVIWEIILILVANLFILWKFYLYYSWFANYLPDANKTFGIIPFRIRIFTAQSGNMLFYVFQRISWTLAILNSDFIFATSTK